MGKKNSSESRHGGKGAPRKSRRRRLWISGTLGETTVWAPTDDNWVQLETAYGSTFDEKFRAGVVEKVNGYFYWESFAPTAPFADEFIKKLVKAKKLANDLEKIVSSFGDAKPLVAPHWERYFPHEEEKSTGEVPFDEDDEALLRRIASERPRRRTPRRSISSTLHAIYFVLHDTLREVSADDAASFAEGDCWKQLILDLARMFRTNGLTATASKDRNKHDLSPFVAFVKELQFSFEERFRRHTSDDALNSEISKILKLLKKHENMKDK